MIFDIFCVQIPDNIPLVAHRRMVGIFCHHWANIGPTDKKTVAHQWTVIWDGDPDFCFEFVCLETIVEYATGIPNLSLEYQIVYLKFWEYYISNFNF